MEQFNFGKRVNICGHEFLLDPGNQKYQSRSAGYSAKIKEASAKSDDEAMRDLTDIYHEIFDSLLGDGAFDTIFELRKPNAFDMASVMEYLSAAMRDEGDTPGVPGTDEVRYTDTRIMLNEILDGMDDTQLSQLMPIAAALSK